MKRLAFASLLFIVACNGPVGMGFFLFTLDGTWDIVLDGNDRSIAILVENGAITAYDQGTGELDELETHGTISQDTGVLSFNVQAHQTFIDFNDNRPAEFVITGEGPIQEDGTVMIFLRFDMVDGDAEGGLDAVMRRR